MSNISELSFMNSTTARDIRRFAVMMWLIYHPFTTLLGALIMSIAMFTYMMSTNTTIVILMLGVTVAAAGKNFIPDTKVQYILTAVILVPLLVYGVNNDFKMTDAITWYYNNVEKIESGPFDEEHDSTPGKETLVLHLKGGSTSTYVIESKDVRTKITSMNGWIERGKRNAVLLPTKDFNELMKSKSEYINRGYTKDHATYIVITAIFNTYSQFMEDDI